MVVRLRNAILKKSKKVYVVKSKLIESILEVLKHERYIDSFAEGFVFNGTEYFCLNLKYEILTGRSFISHLSRVSRPGRRVYTSGAKIPRVFGGLGFSVFKKYVLFQIVL